MRNIINFRMFAVTFICLLFYIVCCPQTETWAGTLGFGSGLVMEGTTEQEMEESKDFENGRKQENLSGTEETSLFRTIKYAVFDVIFLCVFVAGLVVGIVCKEARTTR